jgi:hypothetical protein
MMHATLQAQELLFLFAGVALVGLVTLAIVAYVVFQNIREACKHKPDPNRWSRDWASIEGVEEEED